MREDAQGDVRYAVVTDVNAATSSKFGKYELLDRIAAGGMAEIYRARYEPVPGVSKQVVIKKILPHYAANKNFVAMFTNEARIAIGLSHGNIAQVFDFGTIEGDSYLAMELVDGPPLSKVIRRSKVVGMPVLPYELAVWVTAEMLDGLHYAHTRPDEQGRPLHIVHRDVSPQNVLISYEGQVKIVDFGIAHARTTAESPGSAALKGKYAYFAPEQAKSQPLDARTDVFAAGVMLYELVTGELPFQGKMMEALMRIVKGQYHRPSERNPRVDETLERIIVKALALQPEDRYQTALAFKEDLTRYLISHYPNFTPTRVSHFLQYLFEEELVAQGRPVQLPAEFTRRVEDWKEPLPETMLVPLPPAEPEGALTIDNPISAAFALPALPAPPPGSRWLRVLVLGLASVAVGVTAVLVLTHMSHGTLELASVPPGATIRLDGTTLEAVTPAQIEGLEGGTTHEVRFELAGHEAWANRVPLKRGQTLVVNAELKALPPPPPPPEPTPASLPQLPPPLPPAPAAITWPTSRFELDLGAHRTSLRDATIIDLDVSRTYRVSLSRGPTFGWGFSVVNAAGASVGPLTAAPMSISGAQRLYLFRARPEVLSAKVPDERKARALTLRFIGGRPVATAILPTLPFDPEQRVTISGLDPKKTYSLTVSAGSGQGPAAVLGGTQAGLLTVPVGGTVVVKKTNTLWLTVLDDGSFTATGRLTIELRE